MSAAVPGTGARPDPAAITALARSALAEGEEQAAVATVEQAAERSGDARLWQWAGLLRRALDDHHAAIACFAKAAAIDPTDAGIAHGHARVALEAGIAATGLFETALRLAPQSPDLLLGLAAARLAAGAGEIAERELAAALAAQPMWVQGHMQLAQLRAMLGRRAEAPQSIEQALAFYPRSQPLWAALFDLAIKSEDFDGLDSAVARGRAAGLPEAMLLPFEAIAAGELGDRARADRLFARTAQGPQDPVALWRVRHWLRSGRIADAIGAIDTGLAGPGAAIFWPYASIAWRLAGDPRSAWLEGDERLVRTIDLPFAAGELERLAAHLRTLHVAKGEYLDQSVRGGTQTDGPLLSRVEPEIRALRAKIVDAVGQYAGQLPPPDPRHPLLGKRRDAPVRFAGSWSVRLRSAGRHSNHVHPQGWISSALYVALPPDMAAGEREGWLQLGSPPEELGLDLDAARHIEPAEGRLALFPSWMWHGTHAFDGGERLTVAFDVRPPN